MDLIQYTPLLVRYLQGRELTEEDRAIIAELLQDPVVQRALEDFKNGNWIDSKLQRIEEIDGETAWSSYLQQMAHKNVWPERAKKPIRSKVILSILVACIMAAATFLIWGTFYQNKERTNTNSTLSTANRLPGSTKATLTLSTGQHIVLDNHTTSIIRDKQALIRLPASGQLQYLTDSISTTRQYNLIETPRAGQFSVLLADGTKVWLNNASSLHYPTSFNGKTRTVEVTGEAYFDVSANDHAPFTIVIHRQRNLPPTTVTVLGTKLNIQAYEDDEAVQTTLITGKVKITDGRDSIVLNPGEQARQKDDSKPSVLQNVDLDQVTAWTEGYFHFERSNLASTMKQLARWYDVDIVYDGTFAGQNFTGKIQRSIPLNEVLKAIQTSEVHFHLEGRTLRVSR